MADKCVMKQFLYNGTLKNSETFEKVYKNSDPSVYEVIRMIEGVPLFLEEHYERLVKSLASIGQNEILDLEGLGDLISVLNLVNDQPECNIKLVINNFRANGEYDYYLYYIPSKYPADAEYKNGVDTHILKAVRNNPHAKIINQSLRDQADAMIREKGLFEVILADENNNITEGSRSNIFFIKGNCLYTSPSEGVLLGVTRQSILRVCRENNIEVKEEIIQASSISEFDGAFISGTSPKVLPIKSIGEIEMDCTNKLLGDVMAAYDMEIAQYVKNYDR